VVSSYGYERLEIGRVLSRAFSAIGQNFAVMFGLALLLGVIPLGAAIFGLGALGAATDGAEPFEMFNYFGVTAIALIALSVTVLVLTHAALTPVVIAHAEHRKARFGEALRDSLSLLLPLVGLALVMGALVGIGLMVLTGPGLFLYVSWTVATPAMVRERLGIRAALARSWELVDEERWKILAIVLLLCAGYLVIVFGSTFLAVFVMAASGNAATTAAVVVQSALSLISYALIEMIWASTLTALYVELVETKEGGTTNALEQVFA